VLTPCFLVALVALKIALRTIDDTKFNDLKKGKKQYRFVNIMAPPKGCATHNREKLPFLFLFSGFLGKLNGLAQALFRIEAQEQT
jgi:hypothetical protein